ncbi:hypothetical protein [Neisseria lactamica]|nr:hypothetical protein [Neisseria lactamica]
MREGAECGRKGDLLPEDEALRGRGVSDGIGRGNEKTAANIWRAAL